MIEYLWRVVAWIVSRKPVADWLIRRAQRTPYFHLQGYMERWWLFNGYPAEQEENRTIKWLPSIRIHHILREDRADHMHDHPWNARTILLRGAYIERRFTRISRQFGVCGRNYWRKRGDTATLRFGEFHHIAQVSEGGVWTLFIVGPKCGGWGFLVGGVKVPWREYVAAHPERG